MIINGQNYSIPELNFNTICELEDMGVSLATADLKAMSLVRGFLALAMHGDLKQAGEALESHVVAGGSLDELMAEINKRVAESGFFRALNKGQTQSAPAGPTPYLAPTV